MILLVKEGLYRQLEDEDDQSMAFFELNMIEISSRLLVVQGLNLDQTRKEAVYFGKAKVQLMIQAALDNSETSGHIIKLQWIMGLIIQFYLCSHPRISASKTKPLCSILSSKGYSQHPYPIFIHSLTI